MSDMVSSAFGSLAMMTSVLVSPQGYYEYEAAHGTVHAPLLQAPERRGDLHELRGHHLRLVWSPAQARTSWTGLSDLVAFADQLEEATLSTIASGQMTGDLALITTLPDPQKLSTHDFIRAIADRLEQMREQL